MNPELSSFAARLRDLIASEGRVIAQPRFGRVPDSEGYFSPETFNSLALEMFALQYQHNPAYQKICQARQRTPANVHHWAQIPFVPTSVFKDLELSSIPASERTAVFHSSGTTEQKPSRHFHCAESLAVYEASLWHWFQPRFDLQNRFVCLTPDSSAAPRSSLVHMFETVKRHAGGAGEGAARFFGHIAPDGSWRLDFAEVTQALNKAIAENAPVTILGTAFSFVHLLDFLAENNLQFQLAQGSRVMETGGYKNRSRTMPKAGLHQLITKYLGIPDDQILREYGMSELSSQAYDGELYPPSSILHPPVFKFPPWARVQITSPENGREVAGGQTGLIRIFDLANVFSVAAIQTEDLAVRNAEGFELLGRAQLAEPRGCSLMTA